MWDELCGCIDENWKALKARIQASITGIKLNGTTYYQSDGTGICDLGDIQTEIPKASEIKLDDGRDVQTAIVSIDDAMPDKVTDVAPNAVDSGINIQVTDGNGTIDRMLIRADDSLSFDGLQVGISTKTDGRITEALNTATTAGNKADDAQTDADTALSAATTANTTANTALSKAETAISTANTANSTAETAKTTAETAKTTAETAETTANTANDTANVANSTASSAYQTAVTAKTTAETADGNADSALTKAKNAIASFVTSVTDKILNATVTKGDGSTETTPIFTAGNNLSWNGTTLNAVGGAAYSAGDGITLADGAFSVNYGSGLQLNASTNAIEVDASAILANTALVDSDYASLKAGTATYKDITYTPIGYLVKTSQYNSGSDTWYSSYFFMLNSYAWCGDRVSYPHYPAFGYGNEWSKSDSWFAISFVKLSGKSLIVEDKFTLYEGDIVSIQALIRL